VSGATNKTKYHAPFTGQSVQAIWNKWFSFFRGCLAQNGRKEQERNFFDFIYPLKLIRERFQPFI
jgi:hypothetical protein